MDDDNDYFAGSGGVAESSSSRHYVGDYEEDSERQRKEKKKKRKERKKKDRKDGGPGKRRGAVLHDLDDMGLPPPHGDAEKEEEEGGGPVIVVVNSGGQAPQEETDQSTTFEKRGKSVERNGTKASELSSHGRGGHFGGVGTIRTTEVAKRGRRLGKVGARDTIRMTRMTGGRQGHRPKITIGAAVTAAALTKKVLRCRVKDGSVATIVITMVLRRNARGATAVGMTAMMTIVPTAVMERAVVVTRSSCRPATRPAFRARKSLRKPSLNFGRRGTWKLSRPVLAAAIVRTQSIGMRQVARLICMKSSLSVMRTGPISLSSMRLKARRFIRGGHKRRENWLRRKIWKPLRQDHSPGASTMPIWRQQERMRFVKKK